MRPVNGTSDFDGCCYWPALGADLAYTRVEGCQTRRTECDKELAGTRMELYVKTLRGRTIRIE
eukprot:5229376-Pyramimonas_sp.AAC.1